MITSQPQDILETSKEFKSSFYLWFQIWAKLTQIYNFFKNQVILVKISPKIGSIDTWMSH